VACGLAFLSPRLTARAYTDFYRRVYRPLVSAYHGRLIDRVTVQADQAVYAKELLRFLAPRVKGRAPRRLIDIGGSTGVVAAAVAEALGCRGLVLDPSPAELAEARARGLETREGLLEEFEATEEGAYDLALLCQTVDHLLDIAGALKKIRGLLGGNGLLYVDFVDFRTIFSRHGRIEEAVKVDHPYYLTHETMEAYLSIAGFEALATVVLPDRHHMGYLCRKSPPRDDFRIPADQGLSLLREIRSVQAKQRS